MTKQEDASCLLLMRRGIYQVELLMEAGDLGLVGQVQQKLTEI
jgi:hypothetical protein